MTNTAPRFLVADDTDQVRDMMVLVLQARLKISREQIDAASDAYEASDFLAANSYEAFFTDNDMPGKTGLELIRETRQNPNIQQPKIIMISGDGGEIERLAIEAGADAFLHKPATGAQIKEVYDRVTGAPAANDATYHVPKTGTSDPEPSI